MEEDTREPTGCVHYWIIESKASSAKGRCRKCGEERLFTSDVPSWKSLGMRKDDGVKKE